MDNRRLGCPPLMGLLYLLYLLQLLAGTAAMAMPVTHVLDQDVLGSQRAAEFVPLGQLSIQPFRPDANLTLIASSPLQAIDLARQPGAEFEAALALEQPSASTSLQGSGLRPNSRTEQELFGGGTKDLLISAEVKHVLKELRSELHHLTGNHFARAQAAGADEQAKLARRLDATKSTRDETTGLWPAVSEEERRQGAWRVALMTEQLVDEITPWAITAAVLFGLFHLTRALMRKQAMARLPRSRAKGSAPRPAAPVQTLPAERRRMRAKQRIRLTAASASKSRRKLF